MILKCVLLRANPRKHWTFLKNEVGEYALHQISRLKIVMLCNQIWHGINAGTGSRPMQRTEMRK
jgi:hypothetical protein